MKVISIFSILATSVALPLSGLAETEIPSSVISGGGGSSSAANVTLTATLGQPVAGISAAEDTVLSAGFWPSALFVDVIYENAFEEWMANLPPQDQPPEGQRGPDDTPANDGVKNLVKFAFGLLPMEPSADAAPRIVIDAEEGFLGIDFVRSHEAEVTLAVYGSTNLEGWEQISHVEDAWSDSGLPDHQEHVRLLTGIKAEEHMRYFLRLQVQVE